MRTTTSNPHGEKFTHLYRLNFIIQGHVSYTSQGKTFQLEPNTLIFLPPEAILDIEENSEEVILLFVNFEVGNLSLRQNFNDFMHSTFPYYHVHDQDNILRHLFNQLMDEGNKHEIGYCMSIQGIFYNILMNMIRFTNSFHSIKQEESEVSSSVSFFNQALHYINQNISKNIKINEIASHLGISEIYLYKIFIKYTSKSPQQLLLHYRIQLSKNYLKNPALSIKTISSELGFSNPNHFSTLFKKTTGLSPKQYRQSIEKTEAISTETCISNF